MYIYKQYFIYRKYYYMFRCICVIFRESYPSTLGHAVAQLVEALRYKSEGRGFDSRWCH